VAFERNYRGAPVPFPHLEFKPLKIESWAGGASSMISLGLMRGT